MGGSKQSNFMTAYKAMAEKAGYTSAQAVELRYENVCEELASLKSEELPNSNDTSSRAQELQAELDTFGSPSGTKGSEERKAYFENWFTEQSTSTNEGHQGGPMAQMNLL